ncbi:hypothetical protein [Ferrovum myxofaciens]|uniref:Uncharacterized protein n=1 Tax=Ferrovum myxofaciens TaxID=416213 RepID=A0A9E6N0D2_9PROT|nr:hypothetical protein [Ferrovum myxofaciens]QKE37999.1 MAG: hypothetical protein HO273_04005 [Ferrovum myxofaciens]QWY75699.1 MAG: hypothetical protein JVY19_04515 [Ferrovum myxofaciens]QWY78432.1 MAG: hypothetical protein JZL65_04995 [Ferrovum myxofaciens]
MDSVTVTKKKLGRPTKSTDGVAMPPRLRQRLYRQRKRLATTEAIGNEKTASTGVLIGLLESLAKNDAQYSNAGIKRILIELCNRYELIRDQ